MGYSFHTLKPKNSNPEEFQTRGLGPCSCLVTTLLSIWKLDICLLWHIKCCSVDCHQWYKFVDTVPSKEFLKSSLSLWAVILLLNAGHCSKSEDDFSTFLRSWLTFFETKFWNYLPEAEQSPSYSKMDWKLIPSLFS